MRAKPMRRAAGASRPAPRERLGPGSASRWLRSSSICCWRAARQPVRVVRSANEPMAATRSEPERQASPTPEARAPERQDEQEDQREPGDGQRHQGRRVLARRRGCGPSRRPRRTLVAGAWWRAAWAVRRPCWTPGAALGAGAGEPEDRRASRKARGHDPVRGARCSRRAHEADQQLGGRLRGDRRSGCGHRAEARRRGRRRRRCRRPSTTAASPTATAAWRRTSMPGGNALGADAIVQVERRGRRGRDASRNTAIVWSPSFMDVTTRPPRCSTTSSRTSRNRPIADAHLVGVLVPQPRRVGDLGGQQRDHTRRLVVVPRRCAGSRRGGLADRGRRHGIDGQPGPEDPRQLVLVRRRRCRGTSGPHPSEVDR